MSAFPKKRSDDLEAGVKDEVKKLLTAHGWKWRMPANNGFGKSGTSDFQAMKCRMFMAIETKRDETKHPTKLQLDYLKEVREEGFFGFIVNKHSVVALDTFLTALDNSIVAASKRETVSPDDIAAMANTTKALMYDVFLALMPDGANPEA